MENIKLKRYNSLFEKEISSILQNEVKDEEIRFVTVTGCDITNDLSFCKVYVTVLEKEKKETTMEALKGAASFIREQLSKRIEIRHTPELRFLYDDSIANGERIESIIKEMNEKDM